MPPHSYSCLYLTLGFEECGMRDLMEKEPYPGGKLTPQSTWPDAAQQLGTGTIGEKWET